MKLSLCVCQEFSGVFFKVLTVEFPKLPEPLFIFMAQLLVYAPDILVCKFFQNVATFVSFCFNKLHYLLGGQFSLIRSHVVCVILVDST